MRDIVVIGGGISGLSAAYYIRKLAAGSGTEVNVTLLEEGGRTGGKIRTDFDGGFLVEGGPDSVMASRGRFMELCEELGIWGRVIAPSAQNGGTFIFLDGALKKIPSGMTLMLPTSIGSLAVSDIISYKGKARSAMEVLVPRRTDDLDESVASFVRRRFGAEVYERMAEPIISGIHSGNPEITSTKCTFPLLRKMEAEHRSIIIGMLKSRKGGKKGGAGFVSFDGGMACLVAALEAAVGKPAIRTNSRACRVSVDSGRDGLGRGYHIGMDDGTSIHADAVVFATPAFVTSSLLEGIDRGLASLLAGIPYNTIATVSLAYREDSMPGGAQGAGFLVPRISGMRLAAATWSSSKWAGRAPEGHYLIRCYFSGAYQDGRVAMDNDALVRAAEEDLRTVMGVTARPVLAKVYIWRNGMPHYTLGHDERVASIAAAAAAHGGIFVIGAWKGGAGVPSCISGAYEESRLVVDYISGLEVRK